MCVCSYTLMEVTAQCAGICSFLLSVGPRNKTKLLRIGSKCVYLDLPHKASSGYRHSDSPGVVSLDSVCTLLFQGWKGLVP